MSAENSPSLSVVIPAYHEAENLRVILPRLRRTLEGLAESWEIVVVDTRRPLDGTPAVCADNGARYAAREGGDSYGDAVRTGIKAARGEWILMMDGDGSHEPEFIPALLRERERSDVVIASRYVAGGFSENSRTLRWMSLVLNYSYSLVLGLDCKDVSNSFKLYRGDLLRSVAPRSRNFDVVEEILFKLKRRGKGLRIVEIPSTFKERMFGRTKRNLLLFIATYLYTIIKLRLSR